jgi:hypothetical protein
MNEEQIAALAGLFGVAGIFFAILLFILAILLPWFVWRIKRNTDRMAVALEMLWRIART